MRALLVALLLVPAAAGEPLISAAVPDLPGAHAGDEGVAVWAHGDLSGWTLSDGEGEWTIPAGTVVDGEAWFVGNASAWSLFDGPEPAGEFGAALRLANDGDDVRLIDPSGEEVDAAWWGDAPLGYTSPGMVWRRAVDHAQAEASTSHEASSGATGTSTGGGSPFIDTDSPSDWQTPRIHRVGESDLPRRSFDVDAVTVYASPDGSFDVLTGLLAGASERVALHVYELRSHLLVDALAAAAGRVPVDVLVEGSPVGFDADDRRETAEALWRIQDAGGTAWLAGNGRYAYHHLKVLVVDDAVAVQSENWVPSGVPADPSWGNRGWGVVLHDAALADWFTDWMAADRAAWDTEVFDLASFDPMHTAPPTYGTPTGEHVPTTSARTLAGPFRVTPVIAPEHTADPAADPATALAAQAQQRLWLQQLDFSQDATNPIGWSAPDPLREAARERGSAGVDVRVMAAVPFRYDDTGNQEAMDGLTVDGVRTCTFAAPGMVLHNKGIVADDAVYVGSMNQNHHSRSANREVGVVVEGPRVADWYGDLFEMDWRTCPDARVASPAPAPWLIAAAILLAARR